MKIENISSLWNSFLTVSLSSLSSFRWDSSSRSMFTSSDAVIKLTDLCCARTFFNRASPSASSGAICARRDHHCVAGANTLYKVMQVLSWHNAWQVGQNCLSWICLKVRKPRRVFRLPTSNFQLPTSDFRLPTSDFRLPSSVAMKGGDRPTRLLPYAKMLLVPRTFFFSLLLGRLCSRRLWLSRLFHIERSWQTYRFTVVFVSGRQDLPCDSRTYSLNLFVTAE